MNYVVNVEKEKKQALNCLIVKEKKMNEIVDVLPYFTIQYKTNQLNAVK